MINVNGKNRIRKMAIAANTEIWKIASNIAEEEGLTGKEKEKFLQKALKMSNFNIYSGYFVGKKV